MDWGKEIKVLRRWGGACDRILRGLPRVSFLLNFIQLLASVALFLWLRMDSIDSGQYIFSV